MSRTRIGDRVKSREEIRIGYVSERYLDQSLLICQRVSDVLFFFFSPFLYGTSNFFFIIIEAR